MGAKDLVEELLKNLSLLEIFDTLGQATIVLRVLAKEIQPEWEDSGHAAVPKLKYVLAMSFREDDEKAVRDKAVTMSPGELKTDCIGTLMVLLAKAALKAKEAIGIRVDGELPELPELPPLEHWN